MVRGNDYRSTHSRRRSTLADRALINGRIYTADPACPWAGAVAIREGQFIAVGSREDIGPLIGPDTVVHDLDGAFLMPGLHDMHTHPDLALSPRYADALDVGVESPTPEQLADAVRGYARSHPGDSWIHGQHWVRYTFRETGLPSSAACARISLGNWERAV